MLLKKAQAQAVVQKTSRKKVMSTVFDFFLRFFQDFIIRV